MVTMDEVFDTEDTDLESSVVCNPPVNMRNGHATNTDTRPVSIHHADKVEIGDAYHQHVHYYKCRHNGISRLSRLEPEKAQLPDNYLALKSKLQNIHKNHVLPCVSWLSQGRDLVFQDYYVDLQETDTTNENCDSPIVLEELFLETGTAIPKRILIEGQPGIGKTTLATKLTYDWAMEKPYLQQFDFVFFILLRKLKQRSVAEAIATMSDEIDFQTRNEDLWGKTLLILDGFDEVDTNQRTDVLRILHQLQFDAMTVLVTCRSGSLPVESYELSRTIPEFPNLKKAFYQKKITVLGVGLQNRKVFLEKFCPNQNPTATKLYEDLSNDFEVDLLSNPLVLLMISYFTTVQLKPDEKPTLTSLFKSVFNNVLKAYLTKNGKLDPKQNFDIFVITDGNSKPYQKKLNKFGKLCLAQLLQKKYTFEVNDFTTEIYNLGLLTIHKTVNQFQTKSHYECFHLSIMEFCVAYYLWKKFHSKGIRQLFRARRFRKLQHIMVSSNFEDTTLVCKFFGGLLQGDVIHLFKMLSYVGCDFQYREISFWQLLAEVEESNELAESIAQYVPDSLHFSTDPTLSQFYCSQFHVNIIRHSVRNRKISQIHFQNDVPMNLPGDVTLRELNVKVKSFTNLHENEYFSKLKGIHCRHLQYKLSDENNSMVEEHFSFFLSLSAQKKKTLIIDGRFLLPSFLHSISNGVLNGINFHFVGCLVKRCIVQIICKLLELNRISKLRLWIAKNTRQSDLKTILTAASKSPFLTQLTVLDYDDSGLVVDFHELGSKDWKCLYLYKIPCHCNKSNKHSPCIQCADPIKENNAKGYYLREDLKSVNENCKWWDKQPKLILRFLGLPN